jgi:hypothetical protein
MSQESSLASNRASSHARSAPSTIELRSSPTSAPLDPSDTSGRKTRKRKSTANTWAHAREPQNSEPARCPRKNEKIYYYIHCRDPTYSTTVSTTFRRHLLKTHGIELVTHDHPIKKQRDNLIQDAFAKAGEVNTAKQVARQEETLRAAVNRKAALEALIQLVTVRNLSYNCSSWPELHALICAVNHTAEDLISLSHGSIQKLVSNSFCVHKDIPAKKAAIVAIEAPSLRRCVVGSESQSLPWDLRQVCGHGCQGDAAGTACSVRATGPRWAW